MQVKRMGVIGAGQMGNGIALVAAVNGLDVVMSDIKEQFCNKGVDTIMSNLDRMVKKETITAGDRDKTLARIRTHNPAQGYGRRGSGGGSRCGA